MTATPDTPDEGDTIVTLRRRCTRCRARPVAKINGKSRPTHPEHVSLCRPCRLDDFGRWGRQRRAARLALGAELLACFPDEAAARAFVAAHARASAGVLPSPGGPPRV